MKYDITKEDAVKLREELLQYAETAEQHEYPFIALVHMKLNDSIDCFESISMEEKNSMFRVVYNMIGKDFSEYKID